MLILYSKCEERIERKTEELKESETKADEAERKANALESRNRSDDEKIETLEDQLKVSVVLIYFSKLYGSPFHKIVQSCNIFPFFTIVW